MRFSIRPESSRGRPCTTARYVFSMFACEANAFVSPSIAFCDFATTIAPDVYWSLVVLLFVLAHNAADSGERRAVVQQSVHERAGEMARRRMNDHSGGLVHDDHVVVFEHDVERNVLRLGNRRHRGRNLNLYVVGLRDLHPRLGGDGAVYRDVPGLDEPLYPRPRKVGVKFKDPLVKPLHRK